MMFGDEIQSELVFDFDVIFGGDLERVSDDLL